MIKVGSRCDVNMGLDDSVMCTVGNDAFFPVDDSEELVTVQLAKWHRFQEADRFCTVLQSSDLL